MKHIILSLTIILSCFSTIAQIGVWTTPGLISPEGEDCFNGHVYELKPSQSLEKDFYLIYDKTINDTTVGIFCRSVNTIDEEIEIYVQEGKICSFNGFMGSYNNAYIFYTQNSPGGQRDIYFRRIHNGSFTSPMPFATNATDEFHFRCTKGANRAVWQCGDTIKTKSMQSGENNEIIFTDDELVIEAGGCSSPIINRYNPTIRYIKDYLNSQLVRETSFSDDGDFNITTRFQGHQIKNLKAIPSIFDYENTACSWERLEDQHKIFICDWTTLWQGTNELDSLPWTLQNQFNPSFFHYDIMCDNFPDIGCLALELNNNLSQVIYANDGWFSSNIGNLVRISQLSNPSQNPSLFQGYTTLGGGYFEIILVYEEVLDGKRHLMSCRRNEGYGGTDENDVLKNVHISPNPITSNFSITINNPETSEMQFTLYSLNGMKSKTLSRIVNAGSVNEIQLSVEDFGNEVAPGPYVLECRDGESKEVIKIMIM